MYNDGRYIPNIHFGNSILANRRALSTFLSTLRWRVNEKRGQSRNSVLSKGVNILLEVTLQQTLQSLAVAGLVTSHLVDGVMDMATL